MILSEKAVLIWLRLNGGYHVDLSSDTSDGGFGVVFSNIGGMSMVWPSPSNGITIDRKIYDQISLSYKMAE